MGGMISTVPVRDPACALIMTTVSHALSSSEDDVASAVHDHVLILTRTDSQVMTFTQALMLDCCHRHFLHSAVRRTACHAVCEDILACADARQQTLRLPALCSASHRVPVNLFTCTDHQMMTLLVLCTISWCNFFGCACWAG